MRMRKGSSSLTASKRADFESAQHVNCIGQLMAKLDWMNSPFTPRLLTLVVSFEPVDQLPAVDKNGQEASCDWQGLALTSWIRRPGGLRRIWVKKTR